MQRTMIFQQGVGLICRSSVALCLLVAVGCNKAKVETTLPQLPVLNAPNSGIRLYNFNSTSLDLEINNIQLTNFDSTSVSVVPAPAGAKFFPTGSWPDAATGASFTIPTTLLDKAGRAHLIIKARPFIHNFKSYSSFTYLDTVIENDQVHPTDYFVLPSGHLQVLSRTQAAPSSPFNFKIRVINMGTTNDTAQLQGPASVTYADGGEVSALLNNVAPGMASDYTELPFGAYQFKVFMNNDHTKQLASAGAGTLPIYGCIGIGKAQPSLTQQPLFPTVTTFRPGYTYSIFITPAVVNMPCYPYDNYVKINEYRILAENTTNPNVSFALMQGVNALPGTNALQFRIDGQPLGAALNYTEYTHDFNPIVIGTHTVEVVDQSGQTIIKKTCDLTAYDYFTAWVYEKNGQPDLVFSPNDMTNSSYLIPTNSPLLDGTNGAPFVQSFPAAWQSRFLNLSADLPYATFTNDLASFSNTYNNLGQGVVPDQAWEVTYVLNYGTDGSVSGVPALPTAIRAYASTPGPPVIVPGQLLYNVKALVMKDFIANPALYTAGIFPVTEPGVYSIALAGNTATGAAPEQAAKFIIVKHNK